LHYEHAAHTSGNAGKALPAEIRRCCISNKPHTQAAKVGTALTIENRDFPLWLNKRWPSKYFGLKCLDFAGASGQKT